jgi:hypothetical protein
MSESGRNLRKRKAPGAYCTGDGVHTSHGGAALMAEAWKETVK